MPGLFFDSGIDKTFEKDLERMNAGVNKFANNTDKQGKQVENAFDKMSKKAGFFQSTIGQVVKGFLAFDLIQNAIGFVKRAFEDAFTTIKDFASGISELKALTGLQGDDLQFLSDRAKDMAAQYGKSAREVVDAIKLVGSARPELLGNADALSDMTDKVLILSRASGLDLQQSTEALTGALNQFNEPVSKAGEFIDLYASAAQKGSKEIPFLSDFVLRSGKIAKDANLNFKDLITTAELLGPSFKSPEVAATGFNRILLNLQKSGLGYASGTFKLSDALQDVKNNLRAMTNESEKAAYQNEIFGEGITVGKVLLEKTGKQFDEFQASIGATGSALEQANERMNNLQGDIERGTGIWNKFILSLDEGDGVLSKIARSFVQTKNGLISMLTAVNTEYSSTAEKAHEMNKAASGTIPLWETQVKTLEFLIPSLRNLREEGEKQFANEKKFNEYLIAARKKQGLDEKGNLIKKETEVTDLPVTPSNAGGKGKEVLSYYDELKKKLEETKKGIEKLSGPLEKIDEQQIKSQLLIISGLEKQIEEQEYLLGIKKKEQDEIKPIDLKPIYAYEDKVKKITAQIIKMNQGVTGTSESWKDTLEKINGLNSLVQDLADSIDDSDASLKNFIVNGAQAFSGIVNLVSAIKAVGTASTALDKASGILAIISAAVKVIQSITQSIENKTQQTIQNRIEELQVNHAINKALLEQNALYKEGNEFFSNDKWGTILKGLESYNDALILQKKYIKDLAAFTSSELRSQFKFGDSIGILPGLSTLRERKRQKEIQDLANQYSTDLEKALASVAVRTDKVGRIGRFFGKADQFESLLQLYPQLINAAGELDTILLQTIVDTKDLSEEDRERLTEIIDLTNQASEAYAEFGSYISSIFGEVSNNVTQAFQDMYEGGADAMQSLEESFSKMIETLTRDAIEFAFLQPYLNELNDTTKALGEQYAKGSITADALQTGIINSLGTFYNTLNAIQPSIIEAFKSADELAAAAGFTSAFNGTNSEPNISESNISESNTAIGQIQQSISEETGGILVGRIGALLLSNEKLVIQGFDMLDYAVQNLVYMKQIKLNTDYLPEIAQNTRRTYEKLESI